MIDARSRAMPSHRRVDLRAIVAVGAFAYFVLLADLARQDHAAALTVVNAAIAVAVVAAYIVRAPSQADFTDQRMVVAIVVFVVPAMASAYLRQSFDSALAVLLYAAGFFELRGALATQSARRLFIVALRSLSAVLTIVVSIQMIVPFVEWWALTNWTVVPPLDLDIRPEPWLLHYELALLLILLYPAWWLGPRSRLGFTGRVVTGILGLAVCIIAGSRAVWFAAVIGSLAMGLPIVVTVRSTRRGVAAASVAAAAVAASAMVIPSLWATVLERGIRAASVHERLSVWGPALAEWANRPIVGMGPGSFPWILHRTTYYDTHAFGPRQPDSVVIQLVVEAGALGIVAALIIIGTILPAVLRSQVRPAVFACVAWLAAGVAMNTAESAFLMAAVIGWSAYALPRIGTAGSGAAYGRRFQRLPLFVASSLVCAAFVSTTFGAVAYSVGRAAVEDGRLRNGVGALQIAEQLDPSLAIYPRQRGIAMLLAGDANGAIPALRRAIDFNPTDDLAWRVLGLALSESGQQQEAVEALRRATAVQRSDPTNMLLLVQMLRNVGNRSEANGLLAEVVQAWPLVIASPRWPAFEGHAATRDLVSTALERWLTEKPSPEPLGTQALLLGVVADLDPAEAVTLPTPLGPNRVSRYLAVMRCDTTAGSALDQASDSDRRDRLYWELRIRWSHHTRDFAGAFERGHEIMTDSPVLSNPAVPFTALNALSENAVREVSTDTWGYRRPPIRWPATRWDMPAPEAGFAYWHGDPAASAAITGFGGALESCQAPGALAADPGMGAALPPHRDDGLHWSPTLGRAQS